jgi:hypothetical protein
MITLKQFLSIIDCKITECEIWNADEPLLLISHWDGNNDGRSMDIIFDPSISDEELQVKSVHLHDYKNQRAYRLMHKRDFEEDNFAWEEVKYTDLESDDDMKEKLTAAFMYEEYDERVVIPLDLPDDVLLILMKEAHAKDITFNQYLAECITEKLQNYV